MTANLGTSDDLRETARPKRSSGRAPSLRDRAYEKIKHLIITCGLKPGEVLSEAALSVSLDIGRTPVHQAIDRLVTDGLIDVMPRKGIMVKPVSLDEIFDIIDVRLINESYCARRAAARAEPADIARMVANLDAMWDAAKARAIETMMELDREFHAMLSGTTRNKVLSEILRNLHDRSTRLWFISLRAGEQHMRVCEQHAAIIDGVRRNDPDAAEQAIRAHIEAFRENVTRQL
ncbi:GntR family transcriptional regulator [Rhizobiaceae bacterium BDR2-2]|uniref:GntR family transcriptional regulator n=1 Tax=Ectorhizobium quercum TaxID=2965071 RepID=A0AAE3MZ24_9HYPH|nr:GntR family transcriptional regulator [Ectorhizobium quercum]MCX8997106.1 GntR family transcriptional regulator [Ectorhizobium quercum]